MNTDVYNYMFGSILARSKDDIYLSVILFIVVLFLLLPTGCLNYETKGNNQKEVVDTNDDIVIKIK